MLAKPLLRFHLLLGIIGILVFPNYLHAQEPQEEYQNTLTLIDSTDEEVIMVDVNEDVTNLILLIEGAITNGEVEIMAYDPYGINQVKYSLINTLTKKKQKENETGSMAISQRKRKKFVQPKIGTWEFIISYYDVSGTVDISILIE